MSVFSVALVALVYSTDVLLMTVEYNRRPSALTVASVGVTLCLAIVVRAWFLTRADRRKS